jgi:hypothetical protein
LSSSAKLAVKSLIGRPVGRTVDLVVLEASFARLGVGSDLASALARVPSYATTVTSTPAGSRSVSGSRGSVSYRGA